MTTAGGGSTGRVALAALTDIGMRRRRNEDYFRLEPTLRLAVVCDGMGGHADGDRAARVCAEALPRCLHAVLRNGGAGLTPDAAMAEAVRATNRVVNGLNRAAGKPDGGGMATTVVGLWLPTEAGDRAVAFHVGDSRLYRLRGDTLEALTRDHSLYEFWLGMGGHGEPPPRNVILRAVGLYPDVDVETRMVTVAPGDLLLLMSDGLNGMLADDRIRDLILDHRDDGLERICQALVDAANHEGGRDNITVALVAVS